MANPYQHVRDLWNDEYVETLDPLGRLIYRSNLLGADSRVTNTGGGNTSSKIAEIDPLTGKKVKVLWVKGSGGDLRTSIKENFSSLYQEKLLALQDVYARMDERGPRTPAEDAMVALYEHCTFNLNARACSIDTPLHSFVPFPCVDHTHPVPCIAIAAAANSEKLTREVFGDSVGWLPWQRPGFELGLQIEAICKNKKKLRGVILAKHGLINWANDDRECFHLTVDLIDQAARFVEDRDKGKETFGGAKYKSLGEADRQARFAQILPWLRGQLSAGGRMIATVHYDHDTDAFVNSADAPRLAELGTSCPDHFLRTKIKPLFVDWEPERGDISELRRGIVDGLARYRADYADYYKACRRSDSPPMRDPNPRVLLIPGLGMIAWGKDKNESRITAEFYRLAIQVMRGAEAIGQYQSLPQQEAFDIEYWQLEEAKLRRMPAEKELARRVVAVVGAGSGIGKATAERLGREGAHVVCVDRDLPAAEFTASNIVAKRGVGSGDAGTGLSGRGPAIGLAGDMTKRAEVRAILDAATFTYGGIDAVVVTAGIFVPPDRTGRISDDQWSKTFEINVTGAYIVADEAARLWRDQNLPATLVLTTSANAVVAKKGSIAYDVSKAAANHLVRELALELAPLVRVNGIAPATVVQGSAMFPRDRVIASLAKYEIAFEESETDEQLRDRLAKFYSERTLTGAAVTVTDQAEAIFLLVSDRLAKTTGQILCVDGGLVEAFLR